MLLAPRTCALYVLKLKKYQGAATRILNSVEDQNIKLVGYLEILRKFCSIRFNCYKNLNFTKICFEKKILRRNHTFYYFTQMDNWKKFFFIISPTPWYSYSQLACFYIHNRTWHNKWDPVSKRKLTQQKGPSITGGGLWGYVIHNFWYFQLFFSLPAYLCVVTDITKISLHVTLNNQSHSHFVWEPKYREPVSFSLHQNFNIIMDACEEYARRWAKKEDVEVDTLSEWVKSIADALKRRIRRLKRSVNTRHESIFCDPDVVRELPRLHENFVIVPADKASNNYTFVCRKYYVSILIEDLGLYSLPGI